MTKFIEWVSEKFQHPLSLLFFIFGALLVLFGASNTLNLPGLNQIIPNDDFRWFSVISGCVLFLVSILLYYFPPKAAIKTSKGGDELPHEYSLSLLGRREIISDEQNEVLRYFVAEARYGQYLSQDTLEQKFTQYRKAELFYRLEYLRLLGFLENQKFGKDTNDGADRFSYKLSSIYLKELGQGTKFSQVHQKVDSQIHAYRSSSDGLTIKQSMGDDEKLRKSKKRTR